MTQLIAKDKSKLQTGLENSENVSKASTSKLKAFIVGMSLSIQVF